MEKKLVCPNCGEPFEIDEKGYAAIAKQVRDKEFKEELSRQQASFESEKKTALELAKAQTAENYEKQLAAREGTAAGTAAEPAEGAYRAEGTGRACEKTGGAGRNAGCETGENVAGEL